MQSVGLHRKLSAGESAQILQWSGFFGLQTKPGWQPQVRLDRGSTPGARAMVFVGAAHVVIEPRIVVSMVTVVGVPGGLVTVTGGEVRVAPGTVIVIVAIEVNPELTLITVVPESTSVVVTAGMTLVIVTTEVVPGRVVTDPGSVVTGPGRVDTEPGRVVSDPGRVTVIAGTVTVDSDSAVTEPNTVVTDPERVVTGGGSVVTDPGNVVTDPGSLTVGPETVTTLTTTLVAVRVTGGGVIVVRLPLIVHTISGAVLTKVVDTVSVTVTKLGNGVPGCVNVVGTRTEVTIVLSDVVKTVEKTEVLVV